MSNKQKVQMQRQLKEENRKYGLDLVELGPDKWPAGYPPNLVRTLRNRYFLVQIYVEASNLFRLTINRTTINAQMDWEDGITWEELQALKDQAGFADFDAVEVYPRQADIVNSKNVRHLWVLESPLAFVWRNGEASTILPQIRPAEEEGFMPIGPGPLLTDME